MARPFTPLDSAPKPIKLPFPEGPSVKKQKLDSAVAKDKKNSIRVPIIPKTGKESAYSIKKNQGTPMPDQSYRSCTR